MGAHSTVNNRWSYCSTLSLVYCSAIFVQITTKISAFDNAQRLADALITTQSPHASRQSDSCVGQCALAFMDEMNTEFGAAATSGGAPPASILNLNYNDFLGAFSNATFFEKFCKMYHEFNYCYTKCPHGYMQELLQRSAEIVDHFCVYNYKAIMEKFGCLSSLDRDVSKACLKTCTSHHDAVTSLMQNFKQLALNGDSSQAEHYLAESCEYVICTLHCDVPAIAHTCDFETADLVINLTKKSFYSMQRMALDTGAVSKWPAMCSDIKTYALPKSPQSPPLMGANSNSTNNTNDNVVIAQSPILHDQTLGSENEERQMRKGRVGKMTPTPSPSAAKRPNLPSLSMVILVGSMIATFFGY